jgi:hypothetical protein
MGVLAIHLLRKGEEGVLARVAPGVFDKPIDADLLAEFLDDPRHHLRSPSTTASSSAWLPASTT